MFCRNPSGSFRVTGCQNLAIGLDNTFYEIWHTGVLVTTYFRGRVRLGGKGRFWCAACKSVSRTCSTSTLFFIYLFVYICCLQNISWYI